TGSEPPEWWEREFHARIVDAKGGGWAALEYEENGQTVRVEIFEKRASCESWGQVTRDAREQPAMPMGDVETTSKQVQKPSDDAKFDALLKNLSRKDSLPAGRQKQTAATAPSRSQPIAPLGSQLTTSELDLVKQQIEACWNPPA